MELNSTQFLVTLIVECNQSYEKVVVDSISVRFLFLFPPGIYQKIFTPKQTVNCSVKCRKPMWGGLFLKV